MNNTTQKNTSIFTQKGALVQFSKTLQLKSQDAPHRSVYHPSSLRSVTRKEIQAKIIIMTVLCVKAVFFWLTRLLRMHLWALAQQSHLYIIPC